MNPFQPAWQLAELTRSKQIGCLELLDAYLARVERLNPALNAVIVRDAGRARARARALDQAGPGEANPLFGVPMTVKESFDYAGHATTWGHAFRRDHRAAVDALAIRRIEAAGANVFGKTNVPVSLADWQSYNPVYGSTNNPWNIACTPGGSSGGAAASIAAGLSGLEIGSDIGGSIRVPAHFCGVFGHKPTWGLCSMRGHTMFEAGAPPDISAIGPIARSARDLGIALAAIMGPDPAETEQTYSLPPARATRAADLRVAVWAEQPGYPTSVETTEAVTNTGRRLEKMGARVDFAARPPFDVTEAYHVFVQLLDAALSMRLPPEVLEQRRALKANLPEDDMSAGALMIRATDMTHREWLALNGLRAQIRRAWSAFLHEFDVLLCPACAVPAFAHMQQDGMWARRMSVDGQQIAYNDLLFWPGIVGGFHLPATVAPVARSRDGLPIGVQIVGPLFGDLTTLAVAEMLEASGGNFVAPEGWE
jgi:amidase